mmetsp:Transcript_22643/g.64261  ORF Transcript_22643/g.64261 Transcript_22643/m.64261 type:complete len:208 (+) Transcript_22643:250-873(+)
MLPGGLMVFSRSSCSPTLKTCWPPPCWPPPLFQAIATWMMRTTSFSSLLFSTSRAVSSSRPSCRLARSRRSGSVDRSRTNCRRWAARGTCASGSRLRSMLLSAPASPPRWRYSWMRPSGSRSLRPARTSWRFSAPSSRRSRWPPKLGSRAVTAATTAGASSRAMATPTACASLSSSSLVRSSWALAAPTFLALALAAWPEATKAFRS